MLGFVSTLINIGADVDARDDDQSTPLHLAGKYKDINVVRTLVHWGADVSAVDKDGQAVLHFAAEKNNMFLL